MLFRSGNNLIFSNLTSLSGGTYSNFWDFGDGIGTSTDQNPTYSYRNANTYRVTLTVSTTNNCSSSYSLVLFVNSNPTGSILPVTDTVICDGSFIELKSTPADFYQWYRNGAIISGATSSVYNASDPGTYYVKLINIAGCSSVSSNQVILTKTFPPTPDFNFDRSCAHLSTLFTNTSNVLNSLPVGYSWNFGDTITSNLFSPAHTYQSAGTYKVKLLITPTRCPQLSRFVEKSIVVEDSVVGIKYNSLNAVAGHDLRLQAREFPGASYQWQPGIGLSNANSSNPLFNYNTEQKYLVRILTAAGCRITDTLSVLMFSASKIFVPDYFTPNGDNLNDKLEPLLVGITRLNSFKIWNRWGQLVFQSQKAGEGWDGIYRGVKQPMETYLWTAEGLDIDNKIIRASGTVVLVR